MHEAVDDEGALDLGHGCQHRRVVGRTESDGGQQQQGGVDLGRAVELREPSAGGDAARVDLRARAIAHPLPFFDGTRQAVLADRADAAVEGRPDERPRVREHVRLAADLPDAAVRFVESRRRVAEERALQRPREGRLRQSRVACRVEGHEHLPDDVGLVLQRGAVADAHRCAAPVAGERVELPLQQVALAADAVDDLHLARVARDRPQQPRSPVVGGLQEAVRHEGLERQRRVAQPHEPIVPVAFTAELLRQRGGRGGDDAARVAMGECPEDQQRPHHFGAVDVPHVDTVGPVGPPRAGVVEGGRDVEPPRRLAVGRMPRQHGVVHVSGGDRHPRAVGMVLGLEPRSPQHEAVGAGDRDEFRFGAGAVLPHPGQGAGVVRPHPQRVGEIDRARHADQPPHEVDALDDRDRVRADRERVVDIRDAARRRPAGDERERVAVVVALRDGIRIVRAQLPAAVRVLAQERAEDRRGVVPRQTQPVDGALAGDQGRRAAVAQQRVVRDLRWHRCDSRRRPHAPRQARGLVWRSCPTRRCS